MCPSIDDRLSPGPHGEPPASARGPAAKAGLLPGSLLHVGEPSSREVSFHCMRYTPTDLEEFTIADLGALAEVHRGPGVCWVDVDGLHDLDSIRAVCGVFDIHALVQEDIVSTYQRPKLEDHGRYVFIVMRILTYDEETQSVISAQFSLILGQGFVLTFQERAEPAIEPLRDRLRASQGRVRQMGADYLAYCLLDLVVDRYYVVLDAMEDRIDRLEDRLLSEPDIEAMAEIQSLKRDILLLRRSIWPVREILAQLQRHDSPLVQADTGPYLRDIYDHTVHIMDTVDMLRELASDMLEIYLANVSNRLNEVMKVLTIFASIFIPLTFLVGVYGMNFRHMPELEWRWSYAVLWLAMLSLAGAMLYAFRRKRWW